MMSSKNFGHVGYIHMKNICGSLYSHRSNTKSKPKAHKKG